MVEIVPHLGVSAVNAVTREEGYLYLLLYKPMLLLLLFAWLKKARRRLGASYCMLLDGGWGWGWLLYRLLNESLFMIMLRDARRANRRRRQLHCLLAEKMKKSPNTYSICDGFCESGRRRKKPLFDIDINTLFRGLLLSPPLVCFLCYPFFGLQHFTHLHKLLSRLLL